MSTDAQLAANKANAQHSTGPKTEDGKANSCLNNFRHGFAGSFSVLTWETQALFDILYRGLQEEHRPSTVTEEILVEQMAQSVWLSKRAVFMQDLTISAKIPACQEQKELALYLRYQTTHDRAFHKCLNELLKLRAEKRKQEIGFESQERKRNEEARKRNEEVRKQAAENRKQDTHKTRVWILEAQAEHQELLNAKLETPETRIPGRVERILARQTAA